MLNNSEFSANEHDLLSKRLIYLRGAEGIGIFSDGGVYSCDAGKIQRLQISEHKQD